MNLTHIFQHFLKVTSAYIVFTKTHHQITKFEISKNNLTCSLIVRANWICDLVCLFGFIHSLYRYYKVYNSSLFYLCNGGWSASINTSLPISLALTYVSSNSLFTANKKQRLVTPNLFLLFQQSQKILHSVQ